MALAARGQVSNGSVGDTTANIYGGFTGVQAQALATLVNYGTVSGSAQDGIFLHSGGAVTNGSPSDVRARIAGGAGGVFAPSGVTTVNNFGAIAAVASGFGVYIDGGKVTNGSTLMTGALIQGTDGGVAAVTASAQVTNFGNIDGIGGGISAGMGVSLKAGGTVINGAEGDTAALIEGQGFGVFSQGPVKIANFGTVEAFNGLYLSGGASVTNGSTTDTSASIDAYRALVIRDGAGTLANFGTILSTGTGNAVALFTQGTVVNGAASDIGALIEGGDLGVLLGAGRGTVTEFRHHPRRPHLRQRDRRLSVGRDPDQRLCQGWRRHHLRPLRRPDRRRSAGDRHQFRNPARVRRRGPLFRRGRRHAERRGRLGVRRIGAGRRGHARSRLGDRHAVVSDQRAVTSPSPAAWRRPPFRTSM